ncbi:multidrug effflux MFS transporter [Streptomyces chumphonensis]|uniref:Multidrug effflux MFS transporter n=1 Tax=Streptomyces chumphonensis TaxID=1214925 RepID=A0A927EW67_9ACTN|nr:multidrug effflux MFS transporter [Streptomyces chumphonensis]MBD3930503.1 multidrug effflux MFS transporter [Streptomyces chumphonensis]
MSDPGPCSPAAPPSVAPATTPSVPPATSATDASGRPVVPAQAAPARAGAVPKEPQLTRAQRAGLLLTLVLGSLTALPALTMDLYLPALPQVADALGTEAAQAQLTLTTCLLGLALGQIVVGPMSDQFGRRRPLLVGMACYVAASAACALASGVEMLTVFRLVQGLTGAAGIVIARAVVRDLFDGLAMARFFSTLMLISGAAPVLAPVLGGQLLRVTDWRGTFVALAAVGLVLTLVTARYLPETLAPADRHRGGLPTALRAMRGLLADRAFVGYLIAGSLGFAALFAYIAASPFVVQEIYGASPQTFSLLFMVNSIGLISLGQLNGKVLVGRCDLDRVLLVGLGITGAAAVALLLMTSGVFGEPGLIGVAAGLFVLMSGMGLVLPNANSQGLMRAGHAAGSASALLGTTPFLVGAVASPLVGIAGEHTAVPMAVVQVAALALATAGFVGMCRPWRRRG